MQTTDCDVYVISMPNGLERRNEFSQRAANARASWRFVDALTAPPPGVPYRNQSSLRRLGRPMEPGEIGCYASHWSVWDHMARSGQAQAIVLEDDTIVDWNVLDVIAKTDLSSLGIDLMRLYSTHPFQFRVAVNRFLGPHSHLVEARGLFMGTQGYVVTRRAALRMLELSTEIEVPVDWYMSRYWQFGFRNYCLFPFPILERFSPSQIGDRSISYPLGRAERLERFAWRAFDRLARGAADHIWLRKPQFPVSEDSGPSHVARRRAVSS